jgi:hypothetical protein
VQFSTQALRRAEFGLFRDFDQLSRENWRVHKYHREFLGIDDPVRLCPATALADDLEQAEIRVQRQLWLIGMTVTLNPASRLTGRNQVDPPQW